MATTCQCLSDPIRQRIYRAFQVSVCSSVGTIFVGSVLSLLTLAFQFGWDIPNSLSVIEIILVVAVGFVSFFFLQAFFAGCVILPFALAIGLPIIFLSLREPVGLRRLFGAILGALPALIIYLAMISFPIYWPVNNIVPVVYGACFTIAIVLIEKYC